MNDTTPEAAAELDALLAGCSPTERVRMCSEMFDLTRQLLVARIRAEEPLITDADLRIRLFEHLYGDDFSEPERARIIALLRTGTGSHR